MRNILVTGGAGFIGAHFVHYWLKNYLYDRVIVLDALTYAGDLNNLEAVQNHVNFEFVHGNILDEALLKTLFIKYNIDTVIHFAAETHVDRSILSPYEFIKTNVMGTHTLLEMARKLWVTPSKNYQFHHISTD